MGKYLEAIMYLSSQDLVLFSSKFPRQNFCIDFDVA